MALTEKQLKESNPFHKDMHRIAQADKATAKVKLVIAVAIASAMAFLLLSKMGHV